MWTSSEILEIINKNRICPGESLYIYSKMIFQQKVELFQAVFNGWNLLYSMKANPNKVFLEEALHKGVGIDAASKNEVCKAFKLGYNSNNIFFSAPGKSKNDLLECYNKCVIIADSVNEIKRISELAQSLNTEIRIGIRINIPNSRISGNAFEIMGGVSTKFGMTPKELENAIKICSNGLVKIIGIHVYFGSQILSEEILINNLLSIANFAIEVNKICKLEFVNFGGGFGVPYSDNDNQLDLHKIAHDRELKTKHSMLVENKVKCNIELGRFLVAEAGVFVASIEDIKESEGEEYVILSAGLNGFIRPIFTKEFHKLEKCTVRVEKKKKVTIVGNLCTPIDQYYKNYMMDDPKIGDWVWFSNAGAYGYSMSMLDFISHDHPLEIVI